MQDKCTNINFCQDLQPNLEELDINFDSYRNDLIEFLSSQDQMNTLKCLHLNIKQPIYEFKIRHIIPRFVLQNIKQVETLNFIIDVNGLFDILRYNSQSQEDILAYNVKDIYLNFQTLSLTEQEKFIERENDLNDNTFLQKFFSKIKGITSLRLYFAQSLLRYHIYHDLCEIIKSQSDINQLQTLVICISQSRVSIDLLHIFESIQNFTHLKIFELNLRFSTQVTLSKPKNIITLNSIEDLNLNLMYCPCSNKIMEYMRLKNLNKLKINLSHITNNENHEQNIYYLSEWIKENEQLQNIDINLYRSVVIQKKYYSLLIQQIIDKSESLKQVEISGVPLNLVREKIFEIVKLNHNCTFNFENKPLIQIKDKNLSIGTTSQRRNQIEINILSILLECTKNYLKSISLAAIIDFENEIIDKSQQSQEILKLFIPLKYLRVMHIQLSYNMIFTKEAINNFIQIIDELPLLTIYSLSAKYNENNIMKQEQIQMISNIIEKKYSLKSVRLNSLPYFDKTIQRRASLFSRVLKSLKVVKFRAEIVNELIEYAYLNIQLDN